MARAMIIFAAWNPEGGNISIHSPEAFEDEFSTYKVQEK